MISQLSWGQVWPELPHFEKLAENRRVIPVVAKVMVDDAAPIALFRALCGQRRGTFLLESAERDGRWSRWSFIGLHSRAQLVGTAGDVRWIGDIPAGLTAAGSASELVTEACRELASEPVPGLPPLTGGLVGAFGWDVVYEWEPTLRRQAPRRDSTPDIAVCLADEILAIDHLRGDMWVIVNAINHNNTPDGVVPAYERAAARVREIVGDLATTLSLTPMVSGGAEPPAEPVLDQATYEEMVRAGQRHIIDGDVFQVVLSQRMEMECTCAPIDVYRALRTINPSPYMYVLQLGEESEPFAVVGSSPETLVRITGDHVYTFPIAGSRPRGEDDAADAALEADLLADPKERAEHVMLVDLARNDLAKICVPGSVKVSNYMEIKRFSHIMHIASTVTGTRRPDARAYECLQATFPAGTLSGAPKPRAIEIIDALEPHRRGIYGGVIGYIDFSDNADFAIAIRTAVLSQGKASVQAGAGIVADSQPTTEHIECRNKAAAALRAVALAHALRPPSEGEEQ